MKRIIPELDGVRGMAILPVLGIHGFYGHAFTGGFLGVDIFFVLSGFLITTLLIDEYVASGSVDLKKFYARRALRIIPPLVVGVLIAAVFWQSGNLRASLPAILFFYANLLDLKDLGSMHHTWSLSIEEQFYLFWPALFLLVARRGMGDVIRLTGALIAAAFCLRVVMYAAGFDHEFLYRFTFTRIDDLAAGCLAAVWLRRNESAGSLPRGALSGLFIFICGVFLLMPPKDNGFMLTVGYTFFAFCFALFIMLTVSIEGPHPIRALLSSRAMRYFGRRSYGLYVYHLPIFFALEHLRDPGNPYNFVLVTMGKFAATFAVAEISFRVVESPALALKAKFYSRPMMHADGTVGGSSS